MKIGYLNQVRKGKTMNGSPFGVIYKSWADADCELRNFVTQRPATPMTESTIFTPKSENEKT